MYSYKFKKGFTLVEAMILLLVFSIVLAAMTPIISRKSSKVPQKILHGKYICTKSGASYREMVYKNDTKITDAVVSQCNFIPPDRAAYFLVTAVGGGGGGGGAGISYMQPNTKIPVTSNPISIDILNPPPSLPTAEAPWLTQAIYNSTSKGNFTVSLAGAYGGSGGSYSGTHSHAGTLPYCPVATGLAHAYTYSGGSSTPSASCSRSIAIPNFGSTISITGTPNRNGSSGSSGSGADAATAGYGAEGGSFSVSINSSGVASCSVSGASGGGPASSSGPGSDNASNSLSSSPTLVSYSTSGTTLTAYQQTESKAFRYGEGGKAGEFKSLFFPSLKRNIPITIGAGGTAGNNSMGYAGSTGGITYFGSTSAPLLIAIGGKGGNFLAPASYTPGFEAKRPYNMGYTRVDGGYGDESVFSSFAYLSNLTVSSGLNMDLYGQGGRGGGTKSNCDVGASTMYFNGVNVKSQASSCFAPYVQEQLAGDVYVDNGVTKGGPPSDGNPGAVIITW